jgi:predicted nuclease of restriction endonuclease-like (RecB) superfamily
MNLEENKELFLEIRQLIDKSRQQVAKAINTELAMLYWHIGRTIQQDILHNQRAQYGKQVMSQLSKQLTQEYGKGWGQRHLEYCMRFFELYSDNTIAHTLCAQLSWSHIKLVLSFDEQIKRQFYIQMCIHEKWSVRVFKERIQSMLFERTAISQKPEQTISNDLQKLENESTLNPDLVFRDPYLLDFLNLSDTYSEKDLEDAILIELQRFIIELGSDFAFLARQKRISIDNRDYYIDLLFYHRRLKALVAIDLKIGEFEAAYKGQMELYLNYLQKYESVDGEQSPIGLILCAGKNSEHIELMQLDKSNIRVAEYLTILPEHKVLQEKLHHAIEIAQNKIQSKHE